MGRSQELLQQDQVPRDGEVVVGAGGAVEVVRQRAAAGQGRRGRVGLRPGRRVLEQRDALDDVPRTGPRVRRRVLPATGGDALCADPVVQLRNREKKERKNNHTVGPFP